MYSLSAIMDTGNLSFRNCSEFDSDEYVIVALISASSATLSFIACALVICLIVALKKYRFFVQRLVLYLCISALLNSFSIVLRFQRAAQLLPNNAGNTGSLHILCVITAFIDQTTAWAETIAICCITFNLLMTAVFNKDTERFGLVYAFLILIFPLMFNWIPFLQNTYGEAGAWCWISNLDENCNEILFGVYARLLLWFVPSTTILIIVILVYVFIVIWVTRQRQKWVGKFDSETERKKANLQKEVLPLMLYPFGYLLINLFPLINRIYDSFNPNNPSYALWMLHAIFSPLQAGYIALVYALDKDTRKRLNCQRIKALIFKKEPTISEYPTHPVGFSDSLTPKKSNATGITTNADTKTRGSIEELEKD